MFWRCFIMLAVAGTIAAQAADDEGKKEREKFKGLWRVTAFETNGKELDADLIKRFEWIFENDKVTVKANAQERTSTFTVDPSKKLKTIDLVWKDKTTVGIYDLQGDRLRICLAKEGEKKRPPDFVSKERSDWTLLVLRRQKQ